MEITADLEGRFRRAEETQWTIVILLPLDLMGPQFLATASQGGLESSPKRFGGGIDNAHHFGVTNKRPPFDLGDLVLRERSGNP